LHCVGCAEKGFLLKYRNEPDLMIVILYFTILNELLLKKEKNTFYVIFAIIFKLKCFSYKELRDARN